MGYRYDSISVYISFGTLSKVIFNLVIETIIILGYHPVDGACD